MYKRILVVALCTLITVGSAKGADYLGRSEVKQFIEEFARQHQYPKASLTALFGGVTQQRQVLDAIQRPAEKTRNWQWYRGIFITPQRISEGLQFWTKNIQTLTAARQRFGVPEEIIVAIIGVETFYGRYEGVYPVLDSLVTLGFDYPPRQKFFRSELEHFLLLTQEEQLDPRAIKGSYAGAMGLGQFISSSYRAYAIDFDGNGKRDLWGSEEDAIGSVANYFKRHGWQPDRVVTVPVAVRGDRYTALLGKGLKPVTPVSELSQYDVEISAGGHSRLQEKVILLEFKDDPTAEYWVGFDNFYVITRYNHSSMYAMAVYQLSQRLKQDIRNYAAAQD